MTPDEDRRNLTTMYNPIHLSELQTLTASSNLQAQVIVIKHSKYKSNSRTIPNLWNRSIGLH